MTLFPWHSVVVSFTNAIQGPLHYNMNSSVMLTYSMTHAVPVRLVRDAKLIFHG